jgi:hypothetical protein
MTAASLINRVDGVRQTGTGRWVAKCPAHQDRSPSLSVRELDDGRVLLHCFAGCETADVLAAVGLEFTDLYPEPPDGHRHRPERRPFDALGLLRLVTHEALLVAMAAEAMAGNRGLADPDRERLRVAAQRLRSAADAATLR